MSLTIFLSRGWSPSLSPCAVPLVSFRLSSLHDVTSAPAFTFFLSNARESSSW